MPIETHQSPDGLLTFAVEDLGNGDIALGFEYEWHTHPDLLVGRWGNTETEATRAFIADILNSVLIIAIRRSERQIVDVTANDDPEFDADFFTEIETLELRYWDGRPWMPPVKLGSKPI